VEREVDELKKFINMFADSNLEWDGYVDRQLDKHHNRLD